MGVSSIILERPWLYDHNVNLYGRSNFCSFSHLGKKITIHSAPPKDNVKRGSSHLKEKKQGLHLITSKELEHEINEGSTVWILTTKETQKPSLVEHPQEVAEVLGKFKDVFLMHIATH